MLAFIIIAFMLSAAGCVALSLFLVNSRRRNAELSAAYDGVVERARRLDVDMAKATSRADSLGRRARLAERTLLALLKDEAETYGVKIPKKVTAMSERSQIGWLLDRAVEGSFGAQAMDSLYQARRAELKVVNN